MTITWKQYARSLLQFSAGSWLLLYLVLRTQGIQPFNPDGFHSGPWDLSFNQLGAPVREPHRSVQLCRDPADAAPEARDIAPPRRRPTNRETRHQLTAQRVLASDPSRGPRYHAPPRRRANRRAPTYTHAANTRPRAHPRSTPPDPAHLRRRAGQEKQAVSEKTCLAPTHPRRPDFPAQPRLNVSSHASHRSA
jgi:hypothetical protein